MKDWIATIVLLSSISILYLLGQILIESNLPRGSLEGSYFLISFIGQISVIVTPLMIYTFISLTSYLIILVFTDSGIISLLLRKLWIAFVPILISAMISYAVLLGIAEYDLGGVSENEVMGLRLGFGLTLYDLSLISNFSYLIFYVILTIIIRKQFELSLIQSLVASFFPSLFVVVLREVLS